MKFGVVDLITSVFGIRPIQNSIPKQDDSVKPLTEIIQLKKMLFIEEKIKELETFVNSQTDLVFTDNTFDQALLKPFRTRPTSINDFHRATVGIMNALKVAEVEEVDIDDSSITLMMISETTISMATYLGSGIENGKPFTFLKYWEYLTYTVQTLSTAISGTISKWDDTEPFLKYLDRRLTTYVKELEHHIKTLIELGANNDKDLRNTRYHEFP